MRVAVLRLDGVESAEVSLNEGRVRVEFAAGSSVTIAELRRTIRDQGFTPREATFTLSARIEMQRGVALAIVPGSGASYTVTARSEVLARLAGLAGTTVQLEGLVELDEDGATPERMEVTRVGS